MSQPIAPYEFLAQRRVWYSDTEPRGWAMREEYPERWLRIHSLPEGKRYASSDDQLDILLDRHNSVAEAVLGSAPVALLGYDYEGRDLLPNTHPLRSWLTAAPPIMQIPPDDDDEDAKATSVFGALIEWEVGALNARLLDVAADRLRLMLVNWDTGAAYAPYDGGADLFWPSAAERDLAEERFRAWLSAHPSGL
jgi:hypothetical protein